MNRAVMAAKPAIRVHDVSKRFKMYHNPLARVADYFFPRPGRYSEIWALRDISFSVAPGECFGIIGANGSGKSTLLKLIVRTLLPTTGEVDLQGRALALLELGGGINPELTGRQNVVVSASLMGFPAGYAESKIAEIEAFADIGEFFDRPMRIYSSGMYVRVAFAIYLFMDPDILIVDEALSVGDVFFQQKCFAALQKIMDRGTTVLFVSHDTAAVQKLCNRALVLERGRIIFLGPPEEAVNRYHTAVGQRLDMARSGPAAVPPRETGGMDSVADAVLSANQLAGPPSPSPGNGFSLVAIRVVDEAGNPVVLARIGQTINFEMVFEAAETVPQPDVSIALYDQFGRLVFRTSATRRGTPLIGVDQGSRFVVVFALTLDVKIGQYTYRVGLAEEPDAPIESYAQTRMLGPLVVNWDHPPSPFYGTVKLPGGLIEAEPRDS